MKELEIMIQNWSVVCTITNPYAAPDTLPLKLKGIVYNHPKHTDGESVITSAIKEVDGRKVRTERSIYILGEIDPDYKKWYKEHYPSAKIDESNPIKMAYPDK